MDVALGRNGLLQRWIRFGSNHLYKLERGRTPKGHGKPETKKLRSDEYRGRWEMEADTMHEQEVHSLRGSRRPG